MLYQLSYTPELRAHCTAGIVERRMAAPSQRRALGTLFALIALVFAGVAWAALLADMPVVQKAVIVAASAVLAGWMASLSWPLLRRRR